MRVESQISRSIVFGMLVCIATAVSLSSSRSHTAIAGAASVSADNEGAIVGVINYVGSPPRRIRIDTSADPACTQKNPSLAVEDSVVRRGKLANVFVYLKDGTTAEGQKLSDLGFYIPTSDVTLDQNGCRFVPHVLGILVRQKLRVTNSDPTQHNVHPTPRNNPEWNQSQAKGGPPIVMSFSYPEVLIPIKCNQHPWMKAYVAVLRHPFFAVSGLNGSFEIRGIPAGTYTLAAWHEGGYKGTEQTIEVTIKPRTTTFANFRFGGATASDSQFSLQMLSAIELPMP